MEPSQARSVGPRVLETSNEQLIRISFEQLAIRVGAVMYVFGVVVTDADETPMGRASEALCAELPRLFPEHRFEFLIQASCRRSES